LSSAGNHYTTNLAYLIFNGIVVLILAIVYLVVGVMFIRQLGKTSKKGLIVQMTYLVTGTFVPMFIVKSALILWSAISNGVVPLIVFSLLEIIPGCVLLYYILPQLSSQSEVSSMTRNSTASSAGGMKSLKADQGTNFGSSSIEPEQPQGQTTSTSD